MSSRALRKLQQLRVSNPGNEPDDTSVPQDPADHSTTNDDRVNVFALLDDQCHDLELYGGDETEYPDDEVSAAALPHKTTKTKRKRNKNKQKINDQQVVTEILDDMDEIDRCLAELDKEQVVSEHQSQSSSNIATVKSSGQFKGLLQIEYRLMNPDNELKKIFGVSVLSDSSSTDRRRQQLRQHRRKGLLVQPKDNWPPVVRLGMNMVETGSKMFTVEHSRDYQRSQLLFMEAVETGAPEALTSLLGEHPYHTDTLLQLAEVFRIQEDVTQSADLIERVIYAYESSFSSTFNPSLGICRLDFKHKENRGLFVALLRQAFFLAARYCNRTSLEVCKCLLSLSPESDPMAILLFLDLPCLMSGQEEYFLNMYFSWESTRQLSQLPNWAFSVALAMYRLSRFTEANDRLSDALLLFPAVLLPLLDKLSVKPVDSVTNCMYFKSAGNESLGVRHLCSLYVHRTGHCWKQVEAVDFLVAVAVQLSNQFETGQLDARVKEYTTRRTKRYKKPPLNVWRHLSLSDYPLTNSPANSASDIDPFPPQDSICAYSEELEHRLRARRSTASGSSQSGFLTTLIQSILPNYDPNAPAAAANDNDGNTRGRLQALRDALNEILNNFGPPQLPTEQDGAPQEHPGND